MDGKGQKQSGLSTLPTELREQAWRLLYAHRGMARAATDMRDLEIYVEYEYEGVPSSLGLDMGIVRALGRPSTLTQSEA